MLSYPPLSRERLKCCRSEVESVEYPHTRLAASQRSFSNTSSSTGGAGFAAAAAAAAAEAAAAASRSPSETVPVCGGGEE